MVDNESFSEELNRDLSFFMNLSTDSQLESASTPSKRRAAGSSRFSPFKKPPQKPKRNPVVAKCKTCGKEYRTLRYYKTHLQGHTLKEIASRVPYQDNVMDLAPEVSADVMTHIRSKPSVGLHASEFYVFLEMLNTAGNNSHWREFSVLVCEKFKNLLSAQVFCMPSALIYNTMQIADNILTSLTERKSIVEKLQEIAGGNISVDVLESFLCEFILTFADTLLIHISRRLRDASTDTSLRKITFDEDERQAIYYIGGHICHGFKAMGYKYPQSRKWKIITEVIQLKIMDTKTSDDLTEQETKDRLWTIKKDRGGLVKVTGKMQNFLLSVAEIVASLEESTGSLPIEEILKRVAEGKPKHEWDSVIGNVMEESLSFSLMVGFVRSFINTCGKGIIYRRMNQMNKNKATASLSLRHKVAPKS